MSEWTETDIGLIPIGWQYVPFESVLLQPLRNGVYKSSEYHGRGIRVVNMGEIFAFDKLPSIEMSRIELSDDELEKSCAVEGDLLFARRSLVAEGAGKCTLVLSQEEPLTFESSIIRARPNSKKADSAYLLYLFSSPIGKYLLKTILRQVAVSGITGADLAKLNLPLPSLEEQKKVSHLLSCLDRKIENLRRQNKTLEVIAQTLFKHWFVNFEFPNEDGKPYKSSGGVIERSELGEIPAVWRVGKLGDEFDILMGQSPDGSSYNENGEGLIFFQGRTDFGFRFPQMRVFTAEPKRIANKFDVLVSVRAPVGDINVAVERCCIGRGLSAVSSKYKSYCLYKLQSYRKFFDVFESEGTVFGSLNKQSFNDLESAIPNEKTIETFDSIVSPLDRKIFVNEQEIRTLTKTRDVLLPKLMSGKLRITE